MRGSGGAESLERASAASGSGPTEPKRALIARGYAAADAELHAHGVDLLEQGRPSTG